MSASARKLFTEPRFKHVCRDELVQVGLYSPMLLIIQGIHGLTQADKAVYFAALHHMRGASTNASAGIDRLAAMNDLSRRTVSYSINRLHDAWLIDAKLAHTKSVWLISFAPLDWWIAVRSRVFDPGLVDRLLRLYAEDRAIVAFLRFALAPKDRDVAQSRPQGPPSAVNDAQEPSPEDAAPDGAPLDPPPEDAAPGGAPRAKGFDSPAPTPKPFNRLPNPPGRKDPASQNPDQQHGQNRPAGGVQNLHGRGAEFAREGAFFSKRGADFAPKALQEQPRQISACAALISRIGISEEDQERDRMNALRQTDDDTMKMVCGWEDLLGLANLGRSVKAEAKDLADLVVIAQDVQLGRLGDAVVAENYLNSFAHQIGRRTPPPNSPVGMFIGRGVGALRGLQRSKALRGK